jgi:hypothetical protein
MKINDMFTKGGYIRKDGTMIHDMYLFEVKKPEEVTKPWDYYKVVKKLPCVSKPLILWLSLSVLLLNKFG